MTRIKELRELERRRARQFEQRNPAMLNPEAEGVMDRNAPITSEQKALALGFEAQEPKRLLDLPVGDAGSGQSMFRRAHVFYALDGPGGNAITDRIAFEPYSRAIGLATQRSSNQTPRYWHVSVYGYGVRRKGVPGPATVSPLPESEVRDQFEAIYTTFGPGETDQTTRFVPSVPTCQARIMVFDESGGRFFDVDVIGTRSMTVYGFGVTVFLLIKQNGYEVDSANPEQNEPLSSEQGFEDDYVGARVLPISTNSTQNRNLRTITVLTDSDLSETFVPIPPGALTVQVFQADKPGAGAAWLIDFAYNRIELGVRVDVGVIDLIPGLNRSPIVEIPNAPSVRFRAPPGTGTTFWSLVFEVTS